MNLEKIVYPVFLVPKPVFREGLSILHLNKDNDIEYKDNDILIKGKSLRDAAKNKALPEKRITTLFKFLVPEEKGFDMNTITYDMIEEAFPFAVQLQMVEAINEVISPSYKVTRGK